MSEWKRVKLRDCVEEVNERTTENNQYEVLTSSKSGIYSQEDYFDKQVASKDNTGYKIIKRGQFTYRSMSDNGTFTINRLENRDIGIVSPAYPVFEAISINPEYLKYFFQSEGFRKEIYNLSQGSTRTALKYKDLSNIEILLPTIEEQERIVRILTNIDEVLRNYEKNNNEQINYMNYIMKKTLDKKEDMIKLREIGEIITGNTPKTTEKDNYGEEYNWVTPGDMGISKYITNTERKLSLKGFEKSRKVNKGSILVTCIGSTIGKIGIAGKECSTNQQINSINLFNNINNEYVYYAIKYNLDSNKEKDEWKMLELLLKNGAKTDVQISENPKGVNTPLTYTTECGYYGATKLLLEYGADCNYQENYMNQNGLLALRFYENNNAAKTLQLLLDYGTDLDVKQIDNKTGREELKNFQNDYINIKDKVPNYDEIVNIIDGLEI